MLVATWIAQGLKVVYIDNQQKVTPSTLNILPKINNHQSALVLPHVMSTLVSMGCTIMQMKMA